MNFDDVGCVGAINGLLANQTIGRNAYLVDGEAVEAVISGAQECCDLLCSLGIDCQFAGGETASVGDLVRTLDVGSSVFVRMKRSHVIDAGRMVPGDWIVGFSSTGKAVWEKGPNSSIGSNGLTNARHDTLSPFHRRFPETFAPQMPIELVYRGGYKLSDLLPGGNGGMTIGQALLSPTRTYLPLIKMLIEGIGIKYIHGIIHCSGGGQTKIGKFGAGGNHYIKHDLFPIPPLFGMLQAVSGLPWSEMYQVYNMGHRLEIAFPDERAAREAIDISRARCGIEARVVGGIEKLSSVDVSRGLRSKVTVDSGKGSFHYEFRD